MDGSAQQSRQATMLYGGAIGVGLVVQLLTTWLLITSANSWVRMFPTLFAVLIMAGYLYLSYRDTPEHFETLHFADGFYYLGFLFTLIALILSLIFMPDDVDGSRFILSQFGLALGTTVVGLAGKLLLTLQYEPSAPNLDALINEAKKSLRNIRDVGHEYRGMMRQVTEETRSTLTQGTELLRATVDDMKNPLANALEGFVRELDGANKKVRDSHKELTNAVNGIGTKLSASVSDLTDSLAAAQRESSKIGPLFSGLEKGLSGLTAESESLSKQMASSKDSFGQLMAESTQLLSTSSEAVARAAVSLEKVTGTMLAEAEKGGEAIRDRIKESTESISAYAKALKQAAATVNEVAVRPWQDAAAAQQKNQDMFLETATRASEAVNELIASLEGLSEAEQKARQDFRAVRDEVVTAVRALNDQLGA